MSFFKKYKKKFVAKLRQLRKYYRYKVYFPKKYESYCNQPIQENKVLFLEMRFTTLSNSFQYLYKKLEESGEYDLKCSYVQFNFIRGREFTKRVDDMLQELATAKYVFIDRSCHRCGLGEAGAFPQGLCADVRQPRRPAEGQSAL